MAAVSQGHTQLSRRRPKSECTEDMATVSRRPQAAQSPQATNKPRPHAAQSPPARTRAAVSSSNRDGTTEGNRMPTSHQQRAQAHDNKETQQHSHCQPAHGLPTATGCRNNNRRQTTHNNVHRRTQQGGSGRRATDRSLPTNSLSPQRPNTRCETDAQVLKCPNRSSELISLLLLFTHTLRRAHGRCRRSSISNSNSCTSISRRSSSNTSFSRR